MSKDRPRSASSSRSWLEWLGQTLLGEISDRTQLALLLRDAHQREVLGQDILNMMEGALHIAEKQAADIMVPWSQVVAIRHDEPLAEFLPRLLAAEHSRYPVLGARDQVVGILLVKDLLCHCFSPQSGRTFALAELQRKPIFVAESTRLLALLEKLRTTRNHMAIVLGEYGATGLVTIEDILEEIVGEIEDEHDETQKDYIFKGDNERGYAVKALAPIEVFNKHFHAQLSNAEVDTIGGLVINHFGHLPQQGEQIQIGEFLFTVVHAEARQVHLLHVERLTPQDAGAT